jgi:hypothetical protein
MMEALAKKQCELCLKPFEPDRASQRICPDCMGIEPYPLSAVPDPPTESLLATCKTCERSFVPYKLGKAMMRTICQPCIIARRVKTCRDTWESKGGKKKEWKRPAKNDVLTKTYPPAFLQNISKELQEMDVDLLLVKSVILCLDFTRHPELLEAINKLSDRNFRSPEQQILWMIKMSTIYQAD